MSIEPHPKRTCGLLTTQQAADYLMISPVTLWRLRKTGQLVYHRAGGKLLFDVADLDRYLASCRRNAR